MSGSRPSKLGGRVFVVIPAFNESFSIGSVVQSLRTRYPDVVVVDDGSTDGTSEAAKSAGAIVVRHFINRGQGAALQTGMDYALQDGADFVVSFDADGQHSADDVPTLLGPLVEGQCDVTIGSRFLGQAIDMPWSRRLVVRLGVRFTRWMSGLALTDAHNGLRAFTRRGAERIHLRLDRMAHASEIIDQIRMNQLAFREVPVRIRYTEYSLRKGQSARDSLRIVWDYLLGRMTP